MNRIHDERAPASHLVTILLALLTIPASLLATDPLPEALRFEVTFDANLQSKPFSGRVYVVLSEKESGEPRRELTSWFKRPRIFALELRDHDPSRPIILGERSLSYPHPVSALPTRNYRIQAVARRSLDHPVPGRGPGDLYSETLIRDLDPSRAETVTLVLNQVVEEPRIEETDRVKLVELVSPLLSKFHGREVKLRAAVVLPDGWNDDAERTYPVLYYIGGFGGDHRLGFQIARSQAPESRSRKILIVTPDTQCHHGHSVFADSENNGPWGAALTQELIPYVETRFRGAQSPNRRFVTGVSSGGWSCLWLQVTYPELFNGCWSHCPDPVDFRDFQQINLYGEGSNMFVDDSGRQRPLARNGDQVLLEYEDFVKAEEVLGPGGQIRSFEGVFSPRGADGKPASYFDASTGRVNTEVTRKWERYDIRLILERNWAALGPKLKGKLHVFAGELDTFYLESAVRLLKESLEALGSDAEVVIVPGFGHGLYRAALEPMYDRILAGPEEIRQTPAGAVAP